MSPDFGGAMTKGERVRFRDIPVTVWTNDRGRKTYQPTLLNGKVLATFEYKKVWVPSEKITKEHGPYDSGDFIPYLFKWKFSARRFAYQHERQTQENTYSRSHVE